MFGILAALTFGFAHWLTTSFKWTNRHAPLIGGVVLFVLSFLASGYHHDVLGALGAGVFFAVGVSVGQKKLRERGYII